MWPESKLCKSLYEIDLPGRTRRAGCGGHLPYTSRMTGSSSSPDAPLGAADRPLRRAIDALPAGRLVLAVSGGGDSMALLHAMARWAPERVAMVATFDHGTGAHAREAAALVAAEARRLGLAVVRERALRPGRTEAAWRDARWAFLRRVAAAHRARVATAHTADDQLETIVQRLLRGTGTRGLAALAAPGPVVRLWLRLRRADLAAYRAAHGVPYVDDPANIDRRHQRVRVRLDLLPALEQVDPGFGDAMRALAERAAEWRADADRLVARLPWREHAPGVWRLERAAVAEWTPEQLAVVWPAMLAPLTVPLTAEGTRRLIRFTIGSARAGELRLPGGVLVVRCGDVLEVRTGRAARAVVSARGEDARVVPVGAELHWPGWRIVPLSGTPEASTGGMGGMGDRGTSSADVACFPASGVLEVRRWQPGDRIRTPGARAGRRISRYLAECGIPRLDRSGWPVVLLDGAVVWVPGVCRGLAAPHRSGRSDLIWYQSEREFG